MSWESEGGLTRVNQSSANPLKLQRSAPFPDQHIQRSSANTICVIESRHRGSELDRAEDGGHEDELLPLSLADEGQERADEDCVVDDLNLELVFEEGKIQLLKGRPWLVIHACITNKGIKSLRQEFRHFRRSSFDRLWAIDIELDDGGAGFGVFS